MRYLPHTEEEIAAMLAVIGKSSLDELYATVPESAAFSGDLAVPGALDEQSLMTHLAELAGANEGSKMVSFLGAGMYAHHIPPAVDQLLLRSEFYTAYTPYQPEVAQGTLQAIWEFQTIVSELMGLPLANASMYDGASAAAEACQMARRLTKRDHIVLSECVHPEYRATTETYLSSRGDATLATVGVNRAGSFDIEALTDAITDDTAAIVVSYPSFFGALQPLDSLSEAVHERGALLIVAVTDPFALAIAEPPGAQGADIAVGEGQPLACLPGYGGPGVGLFACRDTRKYMQQLPGRLAGETVDAHGERGFVLTLATREQHIRRERATSNICTNQGLMALSMTIRASMLGKQGFVATAEQCLAKASYLRRRILTLEGFAPAFDDAPMFNEFAVKVRGNDAGRVCQRLEQDGIIAGYDLGRLDSRYADRLLIAVTERHRREDLDRLVDGLDRVKP